MAKCAFCSAPLVANNQYCRYCGNRNDIDLKGHIEFNTDNEFNQYPCPHCLTKLTYLELKVDRGYRIARCQSCLGIFLERRILERLLEEAVSPVQTINIQQLQAINLDRFPNQRPVKYIRCPICQSFMQRTNFAYRSGVIVDICRNHGIWLDAGELIQLMEWKRAGGQILADQEHERQLQSTKPSNLRHDHIESNIEHYREWPSIVDADFMNSVLDSVSTWLKS